MSTLNLQYQRLKSSCAHNAHLLISPAKLPAKIDPTMTGFNDCQKRYGASSQDAMCANLYINSIKDFCIYAPSHPNGVIGDEEENVVSWCLKYGYGTRLIPDGTIQGAHFLKTPAYVQVTAVGDFTKTNIQRGDEGGELDPHGAEGNGNPRGGLVFTRALTGNFQRLNEWMSFQSFDQACIRGCFDGPNAAKFCAHQYDLLGCYWNMPGNYDPGSFDQCDGDNGGFPGIYGTSTFHQGQKPTPDPHPAPASSDCRHYPSVSNGPALKTPTKRSILETPPPQARANPFE